MPLHQNQDGTWQWGKSGKKYKKKQDAVKQMKAIFANGYVEKHASYFKAFNMPSYSTVLGIIKTAAQEGLRTSSTLFLKDGKQHYRIPKGFILSKHYPHIKNLTGDRDYKTLVERLRRYNPGFNPDKLIAGKALNLGLPAENSYPTLDEAYQDMLYRQTGPYSNPYIRTAVSKINPKTKKPFRYSAFGPGQITLARLVAARNLDLSPEERSFLQSALIPQAQKFWDNDNPNDPVWGKKGIGNIEWTEKNKALYNGIVKKSFKKLAYDPAVTSFSTHGSQPGFYYQMARGWHGGTIDENWQWANALRTRRLQINRQKEAREKQMNSVVNTQLPLKK